MPLFTTLCLICNGKSLEHLSLCQQCLDDLPLNKHCCTQCGIGIKDTHSTLCGHCQSNPPYYDTTTSPYAYDDAIKHLIIELKFKKKLINADLLGKLLAKAINPKEQPDYLLPVPMHTKRLRKRGFNQAMELCRVLSRELSIPILSDTLIKTKTTTAQANLSAKQRKENLHNSFAIRKNIEASNIAIVDDVITTGSTMNEIAKILKKSDINKVQAWACARTL